VLVTLSAIACLSRLFADGEHLPPLLATALLAHATAMLLRRTRLGPVSVAGLAAALGVLVLSWIRYLETTFAGIPTRATFRAARLDLTDAWHQFSEVIAPAPALPGFVLGACIAVWLAAWVADWAAFRLGSAVEAVLPAVAIFVFAALLGGQRHRTATTVALVVTALAFILLHRVAEQATTGTWVGDGRRRGPPALVVVGLVMVALAATLAAIGGPRAPGAGSEALVDWNGGGVGRGTRVTVSPLVDIRSRLVDQSGVEAFSVRSPVRSYWRLTALDAFDGAVWTSSGTFGRADGDLPGGPEDSGELVQQDFQITGLDAIWLPAAFEPVEVQTSGADVRFDAESSTLIVDEGSDTSDGVNYRVQSVLPSFTPDQLDRQPGAPLPLGIVQRYLALPERFPRSVEQLARDVMGRGENAYERARLLQDWFRRRFTYDLDGVSAGHGDRAILDFIASKRGYCEQFAGTFAAMARSMAIPARVAVGFTPGELDPDSDGTRYIVRGRNAHAWPEVWIDGVWVPFEPTPGRGAPGAEAWTGVDEQQVAEDDVVPTTGGPVTTTTPFPTTLPPDDPSAGPQEVDTGGGSSAADTSGPMSLAARAGIAVAVLLSAVAAWVGALALARWLRTWRRRQRAGSAAAQVQVAWLEGAEAVGRVAPPARPAETHTEFASRVRPIIGPASEPFARLARLATASEWSGEQADPSTAEDAQALSREVDEEVRGWLEPRQRVLGWFDPRPLLRR
jgi:transglutaminase-like putative cysteine protease